MEVEVPVLTGEEASRWDDFSIREKGIQSNLLMGWAGYSAFSFIASQSWYSKSDHIHLLCGSGNNAGDGYVIAWHILSSSLKKITIWNTGEPKTGDSRYFYELCRNSGQPDQISFKTLDELEADRFSKDDIIIDAIFGTGLNKPLSEKFETYIEKVNSVKDVIRVAVDIPSGVFSDGTFYSHNVFLADFTVSFGSYKIGHLLEPGKLACGETRIFPIGFYPMNHDNHRRLIRNRQLPALRKPFGHKYDSGVVKILGGSAGMEGASILAAKSFLSLGGGLAKIYSTSDKIQSALYDSPELMIQSFEGISEAATEFLKSRKSRNDVMIIGPGLSEDLSHEFWKNILNNNENRIIIDGSGLNHLISEKSLFKENKLQSLILTPHKAEAEKLLGKVITNIREAALEISREYNADVYLKGPGGILVLNHGSYLEEVYLNSSHYELSTGGTGDVLCGVIGNFICRVPDSKEATEAGLAVYMNSADKVVSENCGNHDFLTPSELISCLRSHLS